MFTLAKSSWTAARQGRFPLLELEKLETQCVCALSSGLQLHAAGALSVLHPNRCPQGSKAQEPKYGSSEGRATMSKTKS